MKIYLVTRRFSARRRCVSPRRVLPAHSTASLCREDQNLAFLLARNSKRMPTFGWHGGALSTFLTARLVGRTPPHGIGVRAGSLLLRSRKKGRRTKVLESSRGCLPTRLVRGDRVANTPGPCDVAFRRESLSTGHGKRQPQVSSHVYF